MVSNIQWQKATPGIVGWFAGRTWTNNNNCYAKLPKLLVDFILYIYIYIYTHTHTYIETNTRARAHARALQMWPRVA